MASKVEELRRCILRAGDPAWNEVVDSLIAAASAEGAEAEREKMRSKSDFCSANTSASFFENVYLVPASLLAPDKESEAFSLPPLTAEQESLEAES